MTAFIDANVLVYSATEGPLRGACVSLLRAAARGSDLRTSTAVLEEVWHLERSGRLGDLGGLTRRLYTIFTPLLSVSDGAFRRALAVDASALGSNDRLHVGTCGEHGIATVVTADVAFDRAPGIRRIDPGDEEAIAGLLTDLASG